MSQDGSESDDGPDAETSSTQSRHWLTNDAAALTLILAMTAIVVIAVLGWGNVPDLLVQVYGAGFAVACVWLFGRGAAKYVFGSGD